MNLFRTQKLFRIDQLTRIHHPHMCRMSTAPPGDYRTRCPEGGDIMPEVPWTSDTCVGGVSGLVDLLRTTFVFEINSSGYFSSTGQFIGQSVRRETVRCSLC